MIDTTRCRDDARGTQVPGHGNGSYHPNGKPQPLHVTLVGALTAQWRAFVSTQERVLSDECCAFDWCDDDSDEATHAECARRALDAERVVDLSELLTDFVDDLYTLRFLAIDDNARLVPEPVDHSPIAYLYARRVAQLAGVPLAEDENAKRADEAARDAVLARTLDSSELSIRSATNATYVWDHAADCVPVQSITNAKGTT